MIRESDVLNQQLVIDKKLDEIIRALNRIFCYLEQEKPKAPQYVYGINGLAHLFGCSISTANRIKASGVIKGAITQRNRLIIIDAQKAIDLLDESEARYGNYRFRRGRK